MPSHLLPSHLLPSRLVPSPEVPASAGLHHGLFMRSQALTEGWSPYRIRRLLRAGIWKVVVGDVLAAAVLPVDDRVRDLAATLATGGVLSHDSAARSWGIPVPWPVRVVHVSVPKGYHVRVPGVRLHRRPVEDVHRTTRLGVATTSRQRTLVDCLAAWPRQAAAHLLDEALRARWLSLAVLGDHIRESRGRHGVPQLRELLDEAGAGSRSEAERRLHALLRGAAIRGWLANEVVSLPSGAKALADVWFPAERLVLEIDGKAWHVTSERFQGDRVRQNDLVLLGCTVLRFTWEDISEHSSRVVASVQAALATARPRSAG